MRRQNPAPPSGRGQEAGTVAVRPAELRPEGQRPERGYEWQQRDRRDAMAAYGSAGLWEGKDGKTQNSQTRHEA